MPGPVKNFFEESCPMRLNIRVAALCVALLLNQGASAAQLPQRWVSAGGAVSEWVGALGGESTLLVGGLGPRLPQSLVTLTAGFYPVASATAP